MTLATLGGRNPATASTWQAAAVIATFNRKEELRRALTSCYQQTVPLEVIVLDDGSSDGTGELVLKEFPQVVYRHFSPGNGPCYLRNVGSELASAPIIFPIDDDSVFASPRTVEQTLREFNHPRIAVVAVPFIDVRRQRLRQQAPDSEGIWITSSFVNASHAVRRDIFRLCGGYRPDWFYHGEEGDLSVRMLARGYVVRLGRAEPMEHLEAESRSYQRMDICGRRNSILFAWHNVPMPYLPVHLLGTVANGLAFGLKVRRPSTTMRGLMLGFRALASQTRERRPVPRNTYRLHRRLRKTGPALLSHVEPQLPRIRLSYRPDSAVADQVKAVD
jgi:glycosyltransferase involved in cell wall biosynthesis